MGQFSHLDTEELRDLIDNAVYELYRRLDEEKEDDEETVKEPHLPADTDSDDTNKRKASP